MLTIELSLGTANRIVRLGDEWLLFSGASQQAFSLNPAALYLSDRLEGGTTRAEIVAGLHGGGQEDLAIARAIDDFLNELSRMGGLRCSIKSGNDADMPEPLHVGIGGIAFQLRFWDTALLSDVRSLFDQSTTAATPGQVVIIDIARDGGLVYFAQQDDPGGVVPVHFAVTELRNMMLKHVLARSGEVALHAACLGRHGGAMLLCGAPGAGKSTLTLALLRAGFEYLGDDVTLINEHGEVRALPFPLTLKEGSWPIARQMGVDPDTLPAWHRPDGLTVKYLPLPSPGRHEWRPVRAIASLARGPSGAPSIELRPKPEQLRMLLSEGYAASGKASPDAFAGLVDLVNTANCAEIRYSDAQHAARLLREWYDG